MAHAKKKTDIYVTHLNQLKGGTVQTVIVDRSAISEFGQPLYGLQVGMPAAGQPAKVIHAWILCDPEGNGPGFLEIQEVR